MNKTVEGLRPYVNYVHALIDPIAGNLPKIVEVEITTNIKI